MPEYKRATYDEYEMRYTNNGNNFTHTRKPTRGNYVSSPEKNVRLGGIISRVHEGLGCEINTIRILMRY